MFGNIPKQALTHCLCVHTHTPPHPLLTPAPFNACTRLLPSSCPAFASPHHCASASRFPALAALQAAAFPWILSCGGPLWLPG
jgi:hypothetical protein